MGAPSRRAGVCTPCAGRSSHRRRTPRRQTMSSLSTEVIPAGRRLAFDEHARVFVFSPAEGGTELMRKVRMMNQGLRATFALMARLSLRRHGPYVAQLILHKVLRRFVGFLLLAVLVASAVGVVHDGGWGWWLALARSNSGSTCSRSWVRCSTALGRKVPRLLWIPYYFCLSNLAAALAVLTLAGGTRFEMWEPESDRGLAVEALSARRSHERRPAPRATRPLGSRFRTSIRLDERSSSVTTRSTRRRPTRRRRPRSSSSISTGCKRIAVVVALDRVRVPLAEDAPARCLDLRRRFRRQLRVRLSEPARARAHRNVLPHDRVRRAHAGRARAHGPSSGEPQATRSTPLDWDEVDAMHRSGMAFGSHTMSHPNLAAIDGATARRELRDSKLRLEDRLQVPIASLAYPFGKLRHHVTSRTVDLARESGYEQAVSTHARAIARLGRRHVPAADRHRERHGLAAGREGDRARSTGTPRCARDCLGRCRSARSRVGVDDDERFRRRACCRKQTTHRAS